MARRYSSWGRAFSVSQVGREPALRQFMRFRLLCLVWLAGLLCPTLLWSQPAPGTLLWSFDTGTTIVSSPALALDGTIYVGGQPGLFAITNNGTAASNKWVFFPGESLHGSATVASDGTIYFGGGNFDFYAVNPNGSQKWVLPLQARYESTPAIGDDGTVYFVASGRL